MRVKRKRKRFSLRTKAALPTNTEREKREREREWDEAIFSESSSPSSRANFSNFTRAKKPIMNTHTKLNLPCSRQISVLRISLYPFFPSPRGWTVSGWAFSDCFYAPSSYKCVRFFVTNTCLLSKNTPKKQEIRESFVITRAHISSVSRSKCAWKFVRVYMCVCMFLVCIFSSKFKDWGDTSAFSLRFLRGLRKKRGEKRSDFPTKTPHAIVLIYSVFTHTKHTERERGPLFAAF